jgi:hypothetical protein
VSLQGSPTGGNALGFTWRARGGRVVPNLSFVVHPPDSVSCSLPRPFAARGVCPPSLRAAWAQIRGGLLGAGLLLAGGVRAELEWQASRVRLEPAPGTQEVTALFTFTNRGTEPVKILEVRSGCGCTVTAPETEITPPGETGKIRATFQTGARTGLQTVSIAVTASEPALKTYPLTLEIAITQAATVIPGFVFWKTGDESEAKIMQVELAPGFRFVAAECSAAEFSVEALPGEAGRITLRVTPRDTWAKRQATIKIKVAARDADPVDVLAHARVL